MYWSITFFGRNQACCFTLNDIQTWDRYGSEVEIVLTKSKRLYQAIGNEVDVEAPCLIRIGLILVRTIVMDPSDSNNVARARGIRKKAFIEAVA
ncbi:MAG: hypothetical protein GY866_37120 [Proteobacteria bacterium]|nr:hypothetical protein [Pseudomonadota bacterium]